MVTGVYYRPRDPGLFVLFTSLPRNKWKIAIVDTREKGKESIVGSISLLTFIDWTPVHGFCVGTEGTHGVTVDIPCDVSL